MNPASQFESLSGGGLRVWAPAKINLNLLVGPRRDDGFHGVDSIVAKVTLFDRVELQARGDREVVLRCDGFDCGAAEANLAVRAARRLMQHAQCGGVDISLAKSIPPGMGLGGGSSDAAAVLAGMTRLLKLDVTADRLAELGAALGCDVPLFLGPPAQRMTGRGEVLEPVALADFAAVLVLPQFGCPTAAVYAAFDRRPQPMGRPLPPELLRDSPSRWRGRLENQLTAAAQDVCPPLSELLGKLASLVEAPVCMTGSGSAMFVLCDSAAEAARVAAALQPLEEAAVVVAELTRW
ncbi:MAG: 4-(cytidine 5'-diphospho)-2-C-methyl-D-erythritol kinase [Planctomycetaceae bacterium]|nr:4-(cytidine 5'-diphospho)-2-C-methyl-D-erythritol kinase [Planctomycetaceae bacterium]